MHILLITRHYPPEISGGARRPSLYVEALRELGHRVTLITPFKLNDTDSYVVPNRAISNGLNADKQIDKGIGKPSVAMGIKSWLRIWLYWPDPDIRWANDVIRFVKNHEIRADWIMTTSPPESVHIAGAQLSKYLKVPWLAEMRDTWVDKPHREILATSKLRAYLERRLARRTLKTANALSAVSEAVISEGRKYVSRDTAECIISHFSNTPPVPYKFDEDKLNFVHTGGFSLSDRRRKLRELLQVLESIYAKRTNLIFHIAGPLSDFEKTLIEQTSLPIIWHGSVSLIEARALQAGADALILHTPPNSHALPGKYAEYALAQKPILYLGGGDWIDLVDDISRLRPLATSGFEIEKNEAVNTSSSALTHIQAATALIKFLSSVKP